MEMRSPGNPPLAVRALSLLKKVLETKAMLDQAGITEQYAALYSASGQAFYNTSKFSLRKWGSCSSAGTVTLASDLVDQDPRFQDFVIAHELLHLRVPTHGRLFKALMSAHVPGWRELEERRCSRPFGGGGCGQ
jgi:predicted metal-dependent hydrolase